MIGRRGMLKLIGWSPITARQAAEEAAKTLSGVTRGGAGIPGMDLRDVMRTDAPQSYDCTAKAVGQQAVGDWRVLRDLRDKTILAALKSGESRRELETILYENHRAIHSIDHDLAVNKSWSLAAKLTYQRQRNVAREIEHSIMDQNPWQRSRDWKDRILSFAGIKL